MGTRPVLSRLTAVVVATGVIAGIALGSVPAASAADPPVSRTRVVVPMVFPVLGGASYTDTFLSCRGTSCSRRHLGQDLMAPKMRPLLAAFTGTISYVRRETRVGDGNYFSLTGDNGWTVNYIHANNDTPRTDDGKGTAKWFLLPGVEVGRRVYAGQQLGWSGDSGNAERTAPHTHFELRRGGAWSGTVYNPYASLRAAPVLKTPRRSGPHPDGALLTAKSQGAWVVTGGQRWRVLWANLPAFGWTMQHALKVSTDELADYPVAGWLPLRDGLVASAPDGSTWVVVDGTRIAVPAGTDLADLGTSADRVAAVDVAAIERLPLAEDQTLPGVVRDGALLVDSEAQTRWYVDGAVRREVPDDATMQSWGWADTDLTAVSTATLDAVPVGEPLLLRDGTVATSPAGGWYVVSAGLRRRIASSLVRKLYGWTVLPRVAAPLETIRRLPAGPALP